MNPRIIRHTIVRGVFALPLGIRFLKHEIGDYPKTVHVSTVCLEDGHLEDPLKICSPEHGYETAVFLDGCSFFSIYTAHYTDRRKAAAGHRWAVARLLAGKLPLAIPLGYGAWEANDGPPTEAQVSRANQAAESVASKQIL